MFDIYIINDNNILIYTKKYVIILKNNNKVCFKVNKNGIKKIKFLS